MHRPAFCLLVACLSQLLPAGETSLTTGERAWPERGPGLWRIETTARIGGGEILYRALHPLNERTAVIERFDDRRLGLGWPKGWNWDRESFLNVNVAGPDGGVFDGTARFTMAAAHLLQQEGRAMLECVWPLTDTSEPMPRLSLRITHDPVLPAWLFLRVVVAGDGWVIRQVALRAYPGGTTGPAHRERWVLSASGRSNLHAGAATPQPGDGGLVLHNVNAQTTAGCLLVFPSKEIATVRVAGTYGVRTTLTLPPESRSAHLALGYFADQSWEEAGRMFLLEGRSQVTGHLARTDWDPLLSWETQDLRIQATAALLSDPVDWLARVSGTTVDAVRARRQPLRDRFLDAQTAYAAAKADADYTRAFAAIREVGAICNAFLAQELETLK